MPTTSVTDFSRQHQKAMLFLMSSAIDYAKARCCVCNGLLAHELAATAIEKLMKAALWLNNPARIGERFGHNIVNLSAILSVDLSIDLTRFDDIISRLEKHYKSRYPDDPNQLTTTSGKEMLEVDELYMVLVDALPMPDLVKVRSGVYGLGANPNQIPFVTPFETWLQIGNSPLLARLPWVATVNKGFVGSSAPISW